MLVLVASTLKVNLFYGYNISASSTVRTRDVFLSMVAEEFVARSAYDVSFFATIRTPRIFSIQSYITFDIGHVVAFSTSFISVNLKSPYELILT
jgi:hypothetical protein